MKYPAHIYAKALALAVTTPGAHAEVIAKNLLALLEKNGAEAYAGKSIEEAARFARGKEGIRKITLESARPLTSAQRKVLGALLRPSDVVQEEIVPGLVAGMRVFMDDEKLFDGSLKGKLDAIFKN